MTDPDLVGTTIALGNSLLPRQAPHGANTLMPAEKFVTVHGTTGDIVAAATGKTSPIAPTVSVDLARRQIEVRVPHTAYDPGSKTVRVAAAAGLWDQASDKFMLPQAVADATHPGGALTAGLRPSAYFDVAFRQEPFDSPWRNDNQKTTLASGNISKFFANVDFGKLKNKVDDDSNIPTSGSMDRLYATNSEVAQGRRLPSDPGKPPLGSFTQQNGETLDGAGTPSVARMARTSCRCSSRTCSARPSSATEHGAVVPRHQRIADTLPVDTATQHEPGSTLTPLLPSRRNQPVMEWAGLPDDYIPSNIPRERANAYIAGAQYDFTFDSWLGASSDHVVMCANATWKVLTNWLGDMRGVQDPFHVTYVRNPAMDDPESGLVGDHAYWLSDIQSRSAELGTIDVQSQGFGLKDAPAAPVVTGAGVETGSTVPINAHTTEQRTKPTAVSAPVANRLDITATNIRTVTIDPAKAKVTCDVDLQVTTDGPLTVRLIGCGDHTFG